MHTLCLLDIKVKEISEENLMKGLDVYDPPRYMTVSEALDQLLECEASKEEGILNEETLCVGLARVGHETQIIRAGPLREVKEKDFGAPLHSLVIAGNTHIMEKEVLEMY